MNNGPKPLTAHVWPCVTCLPTSLVITDKTDCWRWVKARRTAQRQHTESYTCSLHHVPVQHSSALTLSIFNSSTAVFIVDFIVERNTNAGSNWVPYLAPGTWERMCAKHANFRTTAPDFFIFTENLSLPFMCACVCSSH